MKALIDRQLAIDSIMAAGKIGKLTCCDILRKMPSAQPDVPDINEGDMISRQAAIDALEKSGYCYDQFLGVESVLNALPSAQPEPIKINIDHELTKEEYEKLRKDMADAPIVLLPSAQPEIIKCKDCKHRPVKTADYDDDARDCGFSIEFPDYKCPCQCDDGFYNRFPDDNWFCGNAERWEE